jgi:hypothetical protein
MNEYQIIEGEWQDAEHTVALLTIREGDGEPYPYGCTRDGDAPVNRLLWDMLVQDSSMVRDSAAVKVMKGEMDAPDGYILAGNYLISEEEMKQEVTDAVDSQLNMLYSGRVMAKAERDPVYAARRKEMIDRLLSMEEEI